jgi:LPS export ABC transporter protein LptC
MKNTTTFIFLTPASTLALWLAGLVPAAAAPDPNQSRSEINHFHLIDQSSDHFTNELNALKAVYFNQQERSELETVRVVIKNDGRWLYNISSLEGSYDLTNSRVHLRKEIKVKSPSGVEVRTDWMEWDLTRKLMTTPKPVQIWGEDLRVDGIGAVFNIAQDQMTLQEKVKMTYTDLAVTSTQGEFFFATNLANFMGAVAGEGEMGKWTSHWAAIQFDHYGEKTDLRSVLLRGDVVYTSKSKDLEIQSQELETLTKTKRKRDPHLMARGKVVAQQKNKGIYMEAEDLKLVGKAEGAQEISLSGNVTVKHNDRTAKSEKALIQMSSNQVSLMNEASIEANGDVVVGKRILFFLNSDRVIVKEASGQLQR